MNFSGRKLASLILIAILTLSAPFMAYAAQGADAENSLWEEVQKGNNVDDYQVYLTEYPQGRYVALARNRIKKLRAETESGDFQKDQNAWQAASQAGGEADYQNYLKVFPQGKFVGLAKIRIKKLPTNPVTVPVHRDVFIDNKARAEIQQSRGLFPEAVGGKAVTLKMAGNVHNTQGYELKIQNRNGICYWEMSAGGIGAYFGAGTLPAVVPADMFLVGRNALTSSQKFSGSIAGMRDGDTLTVKLTGRGLPGETEIAVMETKAAWPEFNFSYAGTGLRITRNYETGPGYLKGKQIAIYNPEIGCAVPVSLEVVEIVGNKLFGQKRKFSEKLLSAEMAVK